MSTEVSETVPHHVPPYVPRVFDTMPDGRPVHSVVLGQAPGVVVELIELGASLHRLEVSTSSGARRNVVLGHPAVADHLASTDYIGAVVGRYANRIADARFVLDGVEHRLDDFDHGHNLHGGPDGFDRRVWQLAETGPDHAVLTLHSPDGDQGFPGALDVRLTVRVEGDTVRTECVATTDAPTVVNLSSHAYYNLDGENAPSIDEHLLTVHADRYTPTDATAIPLGEHELVGGTPFDFRGPTLVGGQVRRPHSQVLGARGIDHNFVLRAAEGPAEAGQLREVAVLEAGRGDLRMALHSDQPGLQVYTGNFLDGTARGTGGALYRQGAGIALEPQLFPDSPNRPEWPSAVLRPGETYRWTSELRFTRPDRS
ncbi:aldose epimerase family protein [Nocardioides pacificus]